MTPTSPWTTTAIHREFCHADLVGEYTVTGESEGIQDVATLTVTPGAFADIKIQPATASIDADHSQSYTADRVDQHGNVIDDGTAATTFSISTGGTCDNSGPKSCRANLIGTYLVTGTNSGFTDTANLTVTPGDPKSLTFTTNPISTYTADDSFGAVATAYDAYGNVAADDVVSVTLSVTGGSTPSGFVVNAPGANPVNTSAGVATFTNVAVRKVGTAYQLRATARSTAPPSLRGPRRPSTSRQAIQRV